MARMAGYGFRFMNTGAVNGGNARFWTVVGDVIAAVPAAPAVAVRLHAYARASQARGAARTQGSVLLSNA